MHTRAERRRQRYVKGMRRVKDNRQWRETYGRQTLEEAGICFAQDTSKKFRKAFSRLADTPQICSCMMCGNKRRWAGPAHSELRAKLCHTE